MNATKLEFGPAKVALVHLPHILLALYAVAWGLMAIAPFNPQDWWLENVLVFVALPALIGTYRKFRFSNASYSLIALFLILHAIGAHYTYTEMPLGNWLRDACRLDRNHYDRVVHFLFGLLISYPLWELLVRVVGLHGGWARVGTVHIVMAWSALYEMIEAVVAQIVSPELGAAYNGIQGDIWDAQKDAALAMIGAVLTMTVTAAWLSAAPLSERTGSAIETKSSPKEVQS